MACAVLHRLASLGSVPPNVMQMPGPRLLVSLAMTTSQGLWRASTVLDPALPDDAQSHLMRATMRSATASCTIVCQPPRYSSISLGNACSSARIQQTRLPSAQTMTIRRSGVSFTQSCNACLCLPHAIVPRCARESILRRVQPRAWTRTRRATILPISSSISFSSALARARRLDKIVKRSQRSLNNEEDGLKRLSSSSQQMAPSNDCWCHCCDQRVACRP